MSAHATTHNDPHGGDHAHHVSPLSMYFTIFALLMVLLVITVVIAYMDLGWAATGVAYLVAIVKGVLIITYFMHVKQQTKLVWIFAGASFLWVAIMLALTLSDYVSRGRLSRAEPHPRFDQGRREAPNTHERGAHSVGH